MRFLAGLVLLIWSGTARSDEAVVPDARLEAAIRAYRTGNHPGARAALFDILADETCQDPAIRIRARVYLGEVLFVEGLEDAAWSTFQSVLEDDPGHRLDPYEHPPDVVAFFETVRQATAALRPTPQPPVFVRPPPSPWLGLAPFGLYQFQDERPLVGAGLLVGQAGLGITSVALWTSLRLNHDYHGTEFNPEDIAAFEAMKARRWVNHATAYGFWALWGLGLADSLYHHLRRAEPSPPLTVGVWPGGVGVDVRFGHRAGEDEPLR